MINLKLLLFLRVFIVKIEARPVITIKKKGKDNSECNDWSKKTLLYPLSIKFF